MSQWYAVRCQSQQMAAAARMLDEAGVTVFMPVEVRWGARRVSGGKARCKIERPLIFGYLFVLIDLTDQARVLSVECIHGFLGFSDELGVTRPLPITPRLIIDLQAAERDGVFDATRVTTVKRRPVKGDRARVLAGTWIGFFVKVLATPKGERVHVMTEGPNERGVTLMASHLEVIR